MPKTQFVFFDAGKTLIDVAPSVGEVYAQIARPHGVTLSPQRVNDGFKKYFPQAPPLCFPGVEVTHLKSAEFRWWKDLVAKVVSPDFFSPAAFAAFFDDLYAVFGQAHVWRVYDDVIETLAALRAHGLRLGVISNFDSRLHGLLEALHLAAYFERVICSAEVGAAKPSVEIYQHAFPKDCPVGSIAMVGNDFSLDVFPPKSLGAQGFWLVRDPRENPSQPHLRSLKELFSRLLPNPAAR